MTPAFLNLLRLHVSSEAYRQLPPDDLWAKVRDALDEIAFRVLLERIGSRIYQRCLAILRDDHLAEEAFQDTLRDLIRKRASIPTYHSAAAWAYRAATNHSRHLRRKGWRLRTRERGGLAVESAVQVVHQVDHADEVGRLLVALPDRFRRPIELVYWQGLTHAETAAALGWPKGTVDSYVAQGLKRLRAEALRLGLPALAIGTILAQPAKAMSEAALNQLAKTAWANGCVPPALVGSWWLNWKACSAGMIASGLVAGGLAIGFRPDARPLAVAVSARPPATAVPETLQERNLRIARDEVAGEVQNLFQRFYPAPHVVEVAGVRAFGSEVEVELSVTPPPPAVTGLAAVSRGKYCTFRRQLTVASQPTGQDRWYGMNPERPIEVTLPNPFGSPFVITRGRDEFAEAKRLFGRLPKDDRAEAELLRMLFGPRGGELLLPTENRGVSGFPGGLILVAGNSGMYVRDGAGKWRYAGECPGWHPAVVDGQIYCDSNAIWSRPLDKPSADWVKWCELPTLELGEQMRGPLFVAGGRLCMTMHPHSVRSRPLNDPSVGWTRTEHRPHHEGLAVIGDTLFGNDGKMLFKRPAAQFDATWVPVGPWPSGCDRLVADADRLLAYGRGPGPIYARAIAAKPTDPWTKVGRVHDPYKR